MICCLYHAWKRMESKNVTDSTMELHGNLMSSDPGSLVACFDMYFEVPAFAQTYQYQKCD